MKTNTRARFCDLIYAMKQKNPQRCLIMVLDSISVKIVSSFMKLKDLIDMGISTIEKLELARKPYPKHDVFYFIEPSKESVDLLLKDFKEEMMYRKVNLIFTTRIANQFIDEISKSQVANRIIQIKSFNHKLYYLQENTFHFQLDQIIIDDKLVNNYFIQKLCELLSTALSSLRPFECLRICGSNQQFNSQFASYLAPILNQWEKSNQLTQEGGQLDILILDRNFDLLTPLLHDFHYESLVVDLLKTDFNPSECEDLVYDKYRYKHIAFGLEGIPAEFQQMVNTNPSAQLHKGDMKDLDLEKMQLIMATMPNYNNQLKDYTFHMNLIEQIWKQFEVKDLKELGDIEQALATGTTNKGHQTKSEQLYQEVLLLLQSKIIQDEDKLRLVLITILTLQMPETERKQLMEKINDQKPIQGLKYLGFDFTKLTSNRITKNINQDTRLLAKQKLSQMTLELQRHTPNIEKIITDIASDQSKYEQQIIYGEIKHQMPEGKSLRQKKQEIVKDLSLLVFVIGGISYAEIASIRNLKIDRMKQIYIGSTRIMSPNQYLEQLRQLQK